MSAAFIAGAVGAVGLAAAATAAYGTAVPRSGLWGPVVWRGTPASAKAGQVALTFDDGPWPVATDAMLDALRELDIKAAFFVIGVNAERWPQTVRRIDAEGHIVGNHTFNHLHWGIRRGLPFWRDQLARTGDLLESILGRRPAMYRPPLGFRSPASARAAREQGLTVVTWSRRAFDGVPVDAETIVQRIGPRTRAGEIVTLHDGFEPFGRRDLESTVRAIRPAVAQLRGRGLNPVRLDELAALKPYR